jgi:hypothetical protein
MVNFSDYFVSGQSFGLINTSLQASWETYRTKGPVTVPTVFGEAVKKGSEYLLS